MPEVRLVHPEEGIRDVMPVTQALEHAQKAGLDLVEVSPKAKPPVCKIMDYGQLLYQQNKQKQLDKKRSKSGEIKGIRLSYNMGKHDIEMRVKQTNKFLAKGNKVKVEMILRGRQKAHPEHVREVFNDFITSLDHEVTVEQALKRVGHKMLAVLTPVKK